MKFRPTVLLVLAGALAMPAAAQAISWIGNTQIYQSGQAFPKRGGFVEPWQTITVTTETWPIESAQQVVAVVETAGWQSAREFVFTWDGNSGNNSRWYAVLGPFPQGSQVNFFLKGTRFGQSNAVFDNFNGANYGYHQRHASNFRRGTILQWFETPYKTIMARLPEVAEAGYSAIYLPAPSKGGGGGFSVGFNPVDRFDMGDRLQKGTVRTKYGTTQELIELVRLARRLGIEVYFDMVINHNDNRASMPIDRYPDMIPEDFHIRSSANTGNSEINFSTEGPFSFGMLNHELVGLVDIAHEDGNNTQNGAFNVPPYVTWNPVGKPSFVRQPITPQYYLNGEPRTEDVREYLERWSRFMVEVIGFNGFRIDAVKHVPPGYFGWAPDQAASQSFSNGNLLSKLLSDYNNLYVFGEIYSNVNHELREYAKVGINPLDFPLKFRLGSTFNQNGFANLSGDLSNNYGVESATGLAFQQGGLSPDVGVSFVQSHDDGPPASNNLAHAFILARPGRAKVYYDGNNVQPGNWSNFPRPGRGDSLGQFGDTVVNLVRANHAFARGFTVNRWLGTDVYVFERQVNNRSVMLFGMNDAGNPGQATVTVATNFRPGTVLRDYTGQMPNVTVGTNGSTTITIPNNHGSNEPNNGRGYVFYAPLTVDPIQGIEPVSVSEFDRDRARTRDGFVSVPFTTVNTPGGNHAGGGTFRATTVRSNFLKFDVSVSSIGHNALIRFNSGVSLPGLSPLSNTPEGLADGFIPMTKLANGQFTLPRADISAFSDGLHRATVRVFSDTGSDPGVFRDFNVWFYVRRGLGTGWSVDGDLTDFGAPIASQTRTPSSQLNRLDALFARNDDRYLYLGIAGRVDSNEQLTNGMGLFLDVDGASGLREASTLADDSGPAARLLSNHRITLPEGFGADYAVGVFRNQSITTSPEAPFFGGPTVPPRIGAQAGVFKINPSRLNWLEGRSAAIASQIRPSPFGDLRGAEIAIPLDVLFETPPQGNPGVNLLAFLGNTGEQGTFLSSVDPLRATLGGRPAPNAWLSNQFLPVQSNVTGDIGTANFAAQGSVRYELTRATNRTNSVALTGGALQALSNGRFRQTVTVVNASGALIPGPIFVRVQVPSGVQVTNSTRRSILTSGAVFELPGRGMPNLGATQLTIEYQSPDAASITPTFELFSGRGVL